MEVFLEKKRSCIGIKENVEGWEGGRRLGEVTREFIPIVNGDIAEILRPTVAH